MRAIIYGRVNRVDAPLAMQVERIGHYCDEHGIEVADTVTDICSGLTLGDNLNRLLEDDRQEFDAIIVRDMSRISRRYDLAMEATGRMKKRNIRLISENDGEIDMDKIMDMRFLSRLKAH